MGGQQGPPTLVDADTISEIQEDELTQRMQYLINAERELRSKVGELESSMEGIQREKEEALDDLKSLQETANRSRADIQKAEAIARTGIEKAEGIRSELVVLEYQRDQARRELGEMEQDVARQSGSPTGPAQQPRLMRSLDNIHLMTSPTPLLHHERTMNRGCLTSGVVNPVNKLKYAQSLSHSPTGNQTRASSLRQLNSAQRDYPDGSVVAPSNRKKPSHLMKEDRPDEEPSRVSQLLQQLTAENEDLRRDLDDSQKKLRLTEENLQRKLQESVATQNQLQREIVDLRNQLHEEGVKLDEREGAMQERDRTLEQVRQQLVSAQGDVRALQEEKAKIISGKTEECQRLEAARDAALVELRETLSEEKEGAMRQLRTDLEKQKSDALALLEDQLEIMRETSLTENQEKNEEILELRSKVRQLEESKESLGVQMRREAEEQIRKAVSTEREVWQSEAHQAREEEKREMEGRLGAELNRLQQQLEGMEQDKEYLKTSLKNLKEENDKLREENLAAGRERVEAVSEVREEMRGDIQTQMDNMREEMTQEKLRETEKLKERLELQEEEISRLKSEVKGYQQKAKDSLLSANVEKIDRSLIHDLNEECQKTANLLGEPARKVSVFMNMKKSASMPLPGSSGDQFGLSARTQLHTAVANMKLTNEELRSYAKKLREDGRQHQMESRVKESELENLQSSINNDKEESRANMEEIREEYQAEADQLKRALNKLRAQEAQNQEQLAQKDQDMRAVQQNMRGWKEETALKMATKFEEELNRELEVRLSNLSLDGNMNNLTGSRSQDVASSPSGVDNNGTLKVMRHLQDKVKQLKMENMQLKRSREGSEESHERCGSKEQQIYRLNQKVKLLDRQLSIAEERCRGNASQLSQSTLEMGRLESALTQQTKELMRMEKAYDRLSKSPSPYGHV